MMQNTPALSAELVEALAAHWGGEPRVFKNALAAPLYSKEDFINVANVAAQRVIGSKLAGKQADDADSTAAPNARVFLGGRPLETLEQAMPFVPQEGDTLAMYEARIRECYPDKEFSIILDNCENVYTPIRDALTPSLHLLFSKIGYPARGNHACFYAGNYTQTPFKIHRDDAHILMFAGFAKKQMAFWPRGRFDERHLFTNTLSMTKEMREEAVVCEIGPLDLMYWSPEYWHIGVSGTHDFHASLSMAVYHKGHSEEYLEQVKLWPKVEKANLLSDYDKLDVPGVMWKSGRASIDAFPKAALDGLRAKWDHIRQSMAQEGEFEFQMLRRILSVVSSAGFGPIWSEAATNVDTLSSDAEFQCVQPEMLAYANVASRLLVAGNGSTFTYAPGNLEAVLAALHNKERVSFQGADGDTRKLLTDLARVRAINIVRT